MIEKDRQDSKLTIDVNLGPTGIIGRPNGYGGGYGPLGGHVGNVPGAYNGPYRPGVPAIGIPYNSNNGRPYAPEFDDYDNDVDKKKNVEKKSIDEKN